MDGATRLNATRSDVSDEELASACLGFHRAHKSRSARYVLHFWQIIAGVLFFTAFVWSGYFAPGATITALHVSALVLFGITVLWRLFAAANLTPILGRLAAPDIHPTYTILCPLYRETAVFDDLLRALDRLDYPKDRLDIKLLVEADDPQTVDLALAAAAPHIEVLIIPAAAPRTKPKALNVGLARARGAFVAVFDAEDRPHPQQLLAALAAFEDGGRRMACVQAPLVVDNQEASWIARQFAAEYAIQFREILPLLAKLGLPLPLGGTSNHFRTDILKACGGWDPHNVTEDADLGYRLAREGYHAGVIGPPTREEAPITLGAWLNQRARWIKGHLQTWLVLMRNPFRTAHEMGLKAFLSMQLVLGGGLLAALVHGPLAFFVLVAMFSHYNLQPIDFILTLSGYCVAIFAALTASALSGNLSHARAAFTMPFYWPLSTLAALRAAVELLIRPHHWSKTTHGVSPRPSQRHATNSNQRIEASNPHMASTSASA
jgi:cellulose synthase/poly-beta-1,6-N-acetylglucosamine synthase-like glycosyltransferase